MKLISLLSHHLVSLREQIEALKKEAKTTHEALEKAVYDAEIFDCDFPYAISVNMNLFRNETNIETVTREGRSFIKVHATPELLDSLITTEEKTTFLFREM
jgi:hypothetical protein